MKFLNDLLLRYKIKDSIIIKKYKKYFEKYKDTYLKEENNQLIYEVMFFYIYTGIDFKYSELQTKYKIKAKIFQTANKLIKKEIEEKEESAESEIGLCNLYSITKNLDDYRVNE